MSDASYEKQDEFNALRNIAERVGKTVKAERLAASNGYRITLGREPITVDDVEFRILRFLAARPYYAFTPEAIAKAVNTADLQVTVDNLEQYILSLRDKLGMFSDYIQSVPYIGYRFKA